MHKLSGVIGAKGELTAWSHRLVAPSIAKQHWPDQVRGLDRGAIECAVEMPYEIPNILVDFVVTPTPIPIWWWRSVYASQNVFAVESFVDELAAAAKKDPYHFRMDMLDKSPRMKKVVETVAAKAGWGKSLPKGHAHGIACSLSFGSYVAEVAEVSVNDGEVRVHKVHAAVDCGRAVSPNTMTYNIEGAIVYGLTAALKGKITIDAGRVQQGSFDDYPLLTIDEMPEVEVHIVESGGALGGIGEPGLPPIAPAVCNAIFAATGKRIRELPIKI
jgi:isoquinoline 1-oxidoreductase beta subunit